MRKGRSFAPALFACAIPQSAAEDCSVVCKHAPRASTARIDAEDAGGTARAELRLDVRTGRFQKQGAYCDQSDCRRSCGLVSGSFHFAGLGPLLLLPLSAPYVPSLSC